MDIKANPLSAGRPINEYIVPLRFYSEGQESIFPLLLVDVKLRALRNLEQNSWMVQARNQNSKVIADWAKQAETKNESMAVRIRIPQNIAESKIDTTLVSR